jgi:hypothetical protein
MDATLIAMGIIFIIFALSDLIATLSNSMISSILAASILVLLGFWTGVIPTTIFEDSGFTVIASPLVAMSLVHMGTMINVRQLREQWRTVIIAVAAIIGVAVFALGIAGPLVGWEEAIVSAPPLAGGVVAAIQMSSAAEAIGRGDLTILATVIIAIQGLVGYPLSSWALKKTAPSLLADYTPSTAESTVADATDEGEEEATKKKPLAILPERFNSNNIMLAKTAIVAILAMFLSWLLGQIAGQPILDTNVIALILGVLFAELSFLESGVLEKANAFGFFIVVITSVILAGLANATPEVMLSILPTLITVLVAGTLGIFIATYIAGRALKVNKHLAFAIGLTGLFGYPGTFIITNEVTSSLAKTDEEKTYLMDKMMPPMLVGGFITVSIGSVLLAGILAPILVNFFG